MLVGLLNPVFAMQFNHTAEGASLVRPTALFTLGSASGSYTVRKVDASSQAGSVTVTLGAPQASGTIPLQQQVAYVMGGVAAYPPDNI